MVAMQKPANAFKNSTSRRRAVHAAAFWGFKSGIVALREDVGPYKRARQSFRVR